MIKSFRVANYLSIKDEMELSFEATAVKDLPKNVARLDLPNDKEVKLLKSVSVYGPNASGKSNLVKAIGMMKHLVLTSNNMNKGDVLPYRPFRLDAKQFEIPTRFEVDLVLDSVLYEYGFEYDARAIRKEFLYYYPNGRKSLIFERENKAGCQNEKGCFRFTVDKSRQELLASMTSDNKLYLSVATNLEYEKTESVFNWIQKQLIIHTTDQEDNWSDYTTHLLSDPEQKNKVLNFLKGADFQIHDIQTQSRKVKIDEKTIKKMGEVLNDESLQRLMNLDELTQINTIKKGYDEQGNQVDIIFDISEESDGTRKFFELAGPFIDMLARGCALIYDELDTSLHPNLILFLIRLFNKSHTNPQLLFTTHNVITLDQKYLRRDQIYLMDMKKDRSSELYSIVDFSSEKSTSNLAKRYLTGRYSGVPFVDEDLVIEAIMERMNG
jgi:hypothetical protein